MRINNFDGDIWNEHQWENHINEVEAKSDQLKDFINSTWGEGLPNWIHLMKEYSSELDAIDAFIEEELLFEEAYFPEDDDDFDSDDDIDDDILFNEDESELFDDYDDDLYDEDEVENFLDGEDWKKDSEDYVMSDYGSIDNLSIYDESRNLGAYLLKYTDINPETLRNSTYVQFVSDTLQVSCKLAAGYSFGFDQDVLGANIVYTKKALYRANRSLSILQTLKHRGIFTRNDYYRLHEWIFELRNDIGIYIQQLRDKFDNNL
jgi:hypothetical protein